MHYFVTALCLTQNINKSQYNFKKRNNNIINMDTSLKLSLNDQACLEIPACIARGEDLEKLRQDAHKVLDNLFDSYVADRLKQNEIQIAKR